MENEAGIFDSNWLGFSWSDWVSLNPRNDQIASLQTDPGVYRVQHEAYSGLVYLGETGRSLRGRLRSLARGIFDGEMPYSDPHTGSPALWAIVNRHGPGFDVSVASPPTAHDHQQRKAIEDTLIALHRRELGITPVGNFGRMPPGYRKSKSRSSGTRGGVAEEDDHRSFQKGLDPLPWDDPEDLTDPSWMGLEWSNPTALAAASSGLPKGPGLYRLWENGSAPPLEYVGQTANLHTRLNTHRRNRDSDLRVSYVETPEIEEQFQRSQAETDLLGAHWLATEQAPRDQY